MASLESDPLLARARGALARMDHAVTVALAPALVKDVEWDTVEIQDPQIHKDFGVEVKVRTAKPDEQHGGSGKAHIIMHAKAHCWPLSVTQLVAVLREVDLFRKEWIKDCKNYEGHKGNAEMLHAACVRSEVASRLLPFGLDEVILREFNIGEEPAALSEAAGAKRSGVVVVESNPPEGATEFEGFPVPPRGDRLAVRLGESVRLLYVTRAPGHFDCCDVLLAARLLLPTPTPLKGILGFVRGFYADALGGTLRVVKDMLDRWGDLGYAKRIAECPEFYIPIAAAVFQPPQQALQLEMLPRNQAGRSPARGLIGVQPAEEEARVSAFARPAVRWGYLEKRPVSSSFGTWQRRFFVLRPTAIAWYVDSGAQSPKGELTLVADGEVTLLDAVLTVVCGGKRLMLRNTHEGARGELTAWTAAIAEQLRALQRRPAASSVQR